MRVFEGACDSLKKRFEIKSSTDFFSPMPKWANWTYSFGGITLLLFLLQIISGTYLTFFYSPSAQDAWTSVKHIESSVFLGHFFRSLHRWGAVILVIFLIAHALRVFISRAYRYPREYIWWTGEVMFMITLSFVLTGYLLPWDIRAYWELLTIRNVALQTPVLGKAINAFLLSASNLNRVPIARFFAMHAIILPILMGFGMMAHFWMIRRLGVAWKVKGEKE